MYIAPSRQGQITLWGQNFDFNRNSLSLCLFVASLKKILWRLIFYRLYFYVVYLFIYLFFHMYIAPGRGRQPIGDKKIMTTERPCLFTHMLQVLKQSLWSMILNTFLIILYMYIAPGQGQKTPWGQTFDVNRKALSLCPFVACFKKISLKSDFIHIFSCFYTCI